MCLNICKIMNKIKVTLVNGSVPLTSLVIWYIGPSHAWSMFASSGLFPTFAIPSKFPLLVLVFSPCSSQGIFCLKRCRSNICFGEYQTITFWQCDPYLRPDGRLGPKPKRPRRQLKHRSQTHLYANLQSLDDAVIWWEYVREGVKGRWKKIYFIEKQMCWI